MTTESKCSSKKSLAKEERDAVRRFGKAMGALRAQPGALIPLLQKAQNMFGYLPVPVLKMIALELKKPYSEVAGVASFYSFFSLVPRGKHLIRVCMGTACYVRGGKQVLDAIRAKLGIDVGQTTADRLFSLEVARCFGACGLAPTMTIDDEIHQRVKAARVQDILEKYRKSNRKSGSGKGAGK